MAACESICGIWPDEKSTIPLFAQSSQIGQRASGRTSLCGCSPILRSSACPLLSGCLARIPATNKIINHWRGVWFVPFERGGHGDGNARHATCNSLTVNCPTCRRDPHFAASSAQHHSIAWPSQCPLTWVETVCPRMVPQHVPINDGCCGGCYTPLHCLRCASRIPGGARNRFVY